MYILSSACVLYAMLLASLLPITQCVCVCMGCHLLCDCFHFERIFQLLVQLISIYLNESQTLSLKKILHSEKVWEVQILIDPSTSERKDLVSTARVTLLANLSNTR